MLAVDEIAELFHEVGLAQSGATDLGPTNLGSVRSAVVVDKWREAGARHLGRS